MARRRSHPWRLTRQHLAEDVRARPQSVDAAAGVIRGVKVLGLVSDNNRRYTIEAVKKAARLYEGLGVFLDHPARPGDQRSARDRIGWLEAVRVEPDGLYADLHLLLQDSATGKILEAAQKRPELFGLSHNAEGQGNRDSAGVFVVEEITAVRSVDLVSEPATNKSLFEGRTIATKTWRQLIEAAPKLSAADRKALLEMGKACEMEDVEMDEPATAAPSPREQVAQAVAALAASEDPADHDMAKKLMAILKPAEAEAPTEEGDDEPDGDEQGDKKAEEAKKAHKPAKGTAGLTEARAKALCKLAGLEPAADVLTAVVGLSEDRALSLLALLKGKGDTTAAPRKPAGARSAPAGKPLTEGKDEAPTDPRQLARWLNAN